MLRVDVLHNRLARSATAVRLAGLAGSILLAVATWRGGARAPWRADVPPIRVLLGEAGWLLLVTWVLGVTLLIWAWWVGRRVVPSTRWAYVTAVLWLLPMLLPPIFGSRDIYSYACQGFAYASGMDPYEGGPAVLGCPWLDATAPVWRPAPAPYGPLYLMLAGGAVRLGGTLAGTLPWLRAIALVGVLLLAVCLPLLARRCGAAPRQAVWLVLACPLVGMHLVSGAHNDALMIGLCVAALTLVAPSRNGREAAAGWLAAAGAGLLLGLAFAVKANAAVLVPFAALAAGGVADRPRVWLSRVWLSRVCAVVGGTVVGAAAVFGVSGLGFGWIRGVAYSGKVVLWTSPSTAVGATIDYLGRPFGLHLHVVAVTRVIGLVLLAAVLTVLLLRARRGDALLGAGLALAATVVFSPVIHPWYLIGPLAILAAVWRGPTERLVRPLLLPCAIASALALPDGAGLGNAVRFPGAVAMTVLVVVLVVRAVRRPRPPAGTPTGPELEDRKHATQIGA